MLRFAAVRILWMVPTLLGISIVTFLLLDLVPADRAVRAAPDPTAVALDDRAEAIARLRVRYGLADPVTREPYTAWQRYRNWLGHAAALDFAPDGEDPATFRRRLGDAVVTSLLLGTCASLLSLLVGVPLGAFFGMRAGSLADRVAAVVTLGSQALPQFLLATLLLLALGGGLGAAILPGAGLRSPGAAAWSAPRQVLDLAEHLVLPIATLALAPTVTVMRYVREAVARTSRAGFAETLRAWGLAPGELRRRILRNSLASLLTLCGTLVPALLCGSIVVEQVFAIPGLGRLGFAAVLARDGSTVMLLTLGGALLTMLSLLASDLLQRAFDPRVELR
jgi:peptide/nickel transport system permease protein